MTLGQTLSVLTQTLPSVVKVQVLLFDFGSRLSSRVGQCQRVNVPESSHEPKIHGGMVSISSSFLNPQERVTLRYVLYCLPSSLVKLSSSVYYINMPGSAFLMSFLHFSISFPHPLSSIYWVYLPNQLFVFNFIAFPPTCKQQL